MGWNKIFAENYFSIYEKRFTDQQTIEQANFIATYVPVGGKILDIPCGFGRHTEALAKLGYNVHGVDLYNINHAEKSLKKLPKNIRDRVSYEVADMRNYKGEHKYDATMSLFSSFGYFSHEDNKKTLAILAQNTKPTGVIIIDVRNPITMIETMFHNESNLKIPGAAYGENASFDPFTNKETISFNVKNEKISASWRHYLLPEFTDMLRELKCHVIHVYGSFKGTDYDPKKSNRMIIIAKHD